MPLRGSRSRPWQSCLSAAGCTDSSSAPVERDHQVLEAKVRRYTGTRCTCSAPDMVRTDRSFSPAGGGAGEYRRQVQLNWRRHSFNGMPRPEGKGWVLKKSDRFCGKVSPLPSGIASRGKRIVGGQKPLNGALKGANTKTTQRGNFQRPVRIPMASNGDGQTEKIKPRADAAA